MLLLHTMDRERGDFMKKPTLCLIFGGKSPEYYVSLSSAYSVIKALEGGSYELIKIGITRDGKWYLYEGENERIANDTWHKQCVSPILLDVNMGIILVGKRKIKPDKILPILHGENGEDGHISALCDMGGLPCAGTSMMPCALCMDKHLTKLVAREAGILVADWVCIARGEDINSKMEEIEEIIKYPCFVKPATTGSSVGVKIVKGKEELLCAINEALTYSQRAIVEKKINARELEIGVIARDGAPYLSRVGEVKYKAEFYDYDAKYKSSENEYQIPANIPKKTEKYLRECAKKLFYALGIDALCRMDFFLSEEGKLILNEVNTMPGFTKSSMFPMLFLNMGHTYPEILNIILNI